MYGAVQRGKRVSIDIVRYVCRDAQHRLGA